jgi:hypothetical protein
LNLETGLREAKLLDDNKQKSSNGLVPISPINEEQEIISKKNLERAFANLNLSKDDVITDKVRFRIIFFTFFFKYFLYRNMKKKLKQNFARMMN